MTPRLSLILPAYNEADALRAGRLDAVLAWKAKQPFPVEVLVVDDGSQDDTAALADAQLLAPDGVVRIEHAGKAAAVMAGIEAARAPVVLFTDMDQATPINHATALLETIESGADVALGSRGLRRPGAPLGRLLMSWGQVGLRMILLGLFHVDTQCGFKAFRRDAVLDVIRHLQLYHPARQNALEGPSVTSGFDVEVLFVARRLGYRLRSVPVNWHYEDTRRVDLRRDALRGVTDLLAITSTRWRGMYATKSARSAPDGQMAPDGGASGPVALPSGGVEG